MGRLENDEADITESFGLKEKYKYLIHTSIPRYKSGHSYHKMKNYYINSLRCAEKKNLKSVVFPVLGAGVGSITVPL
ncbi:MAG: macro domain-containing protein [Ruminococcus sp.]|nr:macro domain-containing protein [Ruminococcus sp.]